MADCPKTPKCIFFNDQMLNKPATSDMMKKDFCQGNYDECARYMVCEKVGGTLVPSDLFPDMVDRAIAQIAAVGT